MTEKGSTTNFQTLDLNSLVTKLEKKTPRRNIMGYNFDYSMADSSAHGM